MSPVVVGLFAVACVLLGFEVIVPGAILGMIAGALMIAGIVVAFVEHGASGGAIALATALVAVAALLYFEFRILPHTPWGRKMFLRAAINGASQAPLVATGVEVIGRDATALTPLGPTGRVRVDGREYEARCESGFADEGARLRVTRVESFQLVVIASG